MLRAVLIAITAVFTLSAIWAAAMNHRPAAWITAIWAVIFLLAAVFERTRYKPELTAPPGGDWVASNELTVDAHGTIRVWYHPVTGERAYVRDSVS